MNGASLFSCPLLSQLLLLLLIQCISQEKWLIYGQRKEVVSAPGIITIDSQHYKSAKVYDLNGKLILSTYNDEINIGHFTEGLYVVKLFDNVDKLMSIQKVIKTN